MRKHQIGILRDSNNENIFGNEEKLKILKSYVEKLFDDVRPEILKAVADNRQDGAAITKRPSRDKN